MTLRRGRARHGTINVEYADKSLPKTSEKNFENDVEAIIGFGGWRTFGSNAAA